MSAAIIHLLNMSGQEPTISVAVQAADYLLEAIRMLQELCTAYPIVARYFEVIRSLATKWSVNLPDNIRQALEAAEIPSPVSSNSNRATIPLQLSTKISPASTNGPSSPTMESRKHSAPDLLETPSNPSVNVGATTTGSQQFLWTPFPESMDGIPAVPPQQNLASTSMDISSILEGGEDGWAQLRRDGFAMDATDFGTPLWEANWEQHEGTRIS
jgi:hypothetical protein